jgi:hypothetical protein
MALSLASWFLEKAIAPASGTAGRFRAVLDTLEIGLFAAL